MGDHGKCTVLRTVGRRKILDFCLICKHAYVAAKAFRGAFELCPDVWQVLGVQLLTCASPQLGALGRLHQVSRSARDGICRIFSKRGLLGLLNARQRSNFVYHLLHGRVVEMTFLKTGEPCVPPSPPIAFSHLEPMSISSSSPCYTSSTPATGSPAAMRGEAHRTHELRGLMLWQSVDRQFHVPLENGRSFRIDVSPLRLLEATCVCEIGKSLCLVHSTPTSFCAIHRVVANDARALQCVHGVIHSSARRCEHPQCTANIDRMHEHVMCSITSPTQGPIEEDSDVVMAAAVAAPSGGGSSENVTPPPISCTICLEEVEGEATCGSGERTP